MRWRHSLLIRLVVICVVIASCSIAATAWIASVSTSSSISQRYMANLSGDAQIIDQLVGYAATHNTWAAVGPAVRKLAADSGRDLILATSDGRLIASSDPYATVPHDESSAAVVNPLAVSGGSGSAGIDGRVIGPFRLTPHEQRRIRALAEAVVSCLTGAQWPAPGQSPTPPDVPRSAALTTLPNGRTEVPATRRFAIPVCGSDRLDAATATEREASRQLIRLTDRCLAAVGYPQLTTRGPAIGAGFVDIGDAYWLTDQIGALATGNPGLPACLDTARREQLTPWVAPPAQLYISDSAQTVVQAGLMSSATSRIALTALAVLALTVALCVFAANRLVRPLRALTAAAGRVGAGDRSARVQPAGGEIGELGTAFNRMASELAEAEARQKDLVSDVAHELRTPLGNIRGWLEAIQDGVAEPNPELVSSLLDESRLLQHVMDDLQDLALADEGRLAFHPEAVDAAAFVAQVVTAHRVDADEHGVRIEIDCPSRVEVSTDPQRLRQVLNNLVANAVRYTPRGGVVRVRARRVDGGIRIEVSDTGIGISPEDLPHVFSRFWRAERSRGRRGGGSGLGLAITRHLVEAQGGTVDVRSELGVGSVFSVRLVDVTA